MQDKSIVTIGKIMGEKQEKPYMNYIQNMFPKKDYYMLLATFQVEKEGNNYRTHYTDATVTDVSIENYLKFGYRKGSARGGDITFTTKAGSINKKFNVFIKQINKAIATAKKSNLTDEELIFRSLKECVDKEQDKIVLDLGNKLGGYDKKQQQIFGLSLRLDFGRKKKYVTDFLTCQQWLEIDGTIGKSTKYSVVSESKDKTCSICMETKPLVHGFASPYKYSTVDKPGMVSGFFKQKNNWKNYPICSECADDFEQGRNYVTQNLRQSFYKKNYFLIPQSILKTDEKFLKSVITTLKNIKYQPNKEGIATINREDYLMHSIGEKFKHENKFTLNLLFYEENMTTKAMKIKLALEEILPSRFHTLFVDVPEKVNKNPIYENAIYAKKEKRDLTFTFGLFRDFFEADFYTIVQSVFLGIPISKDLLFARFMQVIRNNYNKKQSSDTYVEWGIVTIKKAHLLLAYLHQLNLISSPQNSNKTMEENIHHSEEELSEAVKKNKFDQIKFEEFLSKHSDKFFSSEIQKGIFSIGVLTRLLFNIQSAKLEGNTPFEKKLYGYNLDPAKIKKVYCQALEKIEQYTSFFSYLKLRDRINELFTLESSNLKEMTNDEISFYFVAGLEMGNDFKTTENNKK